MRITAIKQQVKRADRYSLYVDDKYAFSLSESALLEQKIVSGQDIDAAQLKRFKQVSQDDKAYNNALRYAAMRLRSEWELRTYLQRKHVEEPVVEGIIGRLRRIELLNDQAFARAWVGNRRVLKAVSKRKLYQELKQKHVAEEIIGQVLNEDETDERTVLRELIAKKRRLSKYAADPTKLMQYLARQGFGYDDIKTVMEEA